MSIPINTDNSVQLSYSSFPFAISDIDNYATSNFVSNVSNALRTAINTKQDTLTAATNLLGVGTSITAIDYNKVSVNKPTNFQADWNSTIINKPTIYTQSQIDTFLNAKQNNLTAATTLLGTGGSITGINYNTVINKPSYSTPLSSNIATNTISIDLSNYYNQTQVNTAIGNTSNYSLNISNILTTRDATNLSSSSNYSLNISNILKANIDTKDNILSFTSPLTRTTNTIGINLGAYSTTGTDTNYLLKSGGTMTGALTTPNITLGGTSGKINVYDDYHYIEFSQPTDTTTIQEYGTIKFNIGQSKTTKAYINSSGLTATAFSGDGANITNVPYLTITGKPTNFQADWNTTIINKPSTFPVDTSIYYNKTEVNNLLNAKDAILSFTSPLIRTANTITFSESAITTLTNFYNKTEANSLLNEKDAILSFTSPLIRTANTITFSESAITTLTNFYNKTETNSLLNAKQATLTFSSPLVNTTNTITFNESSITTLTNFYNKTEANERYLQLSGGTMTSNLNISYANPILTIKGTLENQKSILYLSTPYNTSSALKTAIIAEGLGSWGRSKLHFCLNNTGDGLPVPVPNWNDFTNYSASIADARMTILPSGNVGIANVNPSQIFQVGNAGRLRISNGTTDYSLLGTIDTDGATNTRIVLSGNTRSGGPGNIEYVATSTGSHIFYTTNSTTQRMRINSDGLITTSGNIDCGGGLAITGSTAFFNIAGVNAENLTNTYINFKAAGSGNDWCYLRQIGGNEAYKLAFDFLDDADDARFCIRKNTSVNNPDTITEVFTINNGDVSCTGTLTAGGNVGIGGAPTLDKLDVYGSANIRGSLSVQSQDLNIFKSSGGFGGNINAGGNITCLLYAITNSGTDYVGVGNATSGNNNNYLRQLYIMFETFTGFHRCFTNDELFDNENPQSFKDTYIGRIVVSTGKIATDFKSIDNDDWEIKYDKEGITIEDALPMIELSRKKKDKRVFGVLGNSKRNNSRSERLIINSVGEGGIFVCNSNGNIENGDYIQSSDHLGYGEKQDDDLLHNYTVAKATMDCNFELDNPLYNCFELDDGLRVAFVAATYHCG